MKFSEELLDKLLEHKKHHTDKHMRVMLVLMDKYKMDFDEAHKKTKQLYGD